MNCDCSMEDGDSPECFSSEKVKAKKKYLCCECNEPINPGDHYFSDKGLWCGEWGRYKTCIPCKSIRDDYCDSYVYGSLRIAILECLGFDYTSVEEGL